MPPGRTIAEVYVSVRADTTHLRPDIEHGIGRIDTKSAGNKAGHDYGSAFGSAAKKLVLGAVAVIGSRALINGAKSAVNAASDLNETVSKTQQIFGKSAAGVIKFGDASTRALGQSKNAALTAASNYGNLFNNLGFTQKASAKMSTQLLKTAADLASFNNASPEEMLDGISSALAGEYDPLQRYGLAITAATVQQFALSHGLAKTAKDITPAIKAQASYAIILEQTGKASGDFARTAGGLANQQRIAGAQAENLKAKIGEALKPAMLGLFTTLNRDLLPEFSRFADKEAPKLGAALGALAEKVGPKLAAAFHQGFLGIDAFFAAFREGDVTSTGFVGFMERAGVAVRNLNAGFKGSGPIDGYSGKLNTLGLGVRALIASYKEGDVTSTGFIGAMEQIGVSLSHVRDYLKQIDFSKVGSDASSAGASIGRIDFQKVFNQLKSIDTAKIGDGFRVLGVGVGFLADHIDLLVKALPFLIAAFAAYKAAEAAGNVAAIASIPIRVAQVGSNILLARSIKALATSNVQNTVATGAATTSAIVNTAVTNAMTATTERGTLATIASATAQKVIAVATKAWAAAQFVLNAVLSLNPIGLVIIGIAALIAVVVLIATKTTWFQTIWKASWATVQLVFTTVLNFIKNNWPLLLAILTGPVGAAVVIIVRNWDKIKTAAATMLGALKTIWNDAVRYLLLKFLDVVGGVLSGAAKMLGWVPGIGDKLKAAAAAFKKFRDDVNAALGGVKNRNVTVKASTLIAGGVDRATAIGDALHRARGGPVWGGGTETSDSIPAMLSKNEHVLSAREVRGLGGHSAVAQMRKAATSGAAFARGGPAGFTLSPQLDNLVAFKAGLAAFNARVDALARKQAAAAGFSANLGGVVNFAKSVAGHPYVWGGAQPSGSDCSGFVSMLVEVAKGKKPGGRLFATGSLPAGQFAESGNINRAFKIGWFTGNPGHVAATVNGIGMESRGGDGVVVNGYNGSSRGSEYPYFTRHAYLKLANGGPVLPGDPPFDVLDRNGRHYRRGLLAQLQDLALYDTGGYLPPGVSVAVNNTGGRERVLDRAETAAYESGGITVAQLREALTGLTFTVEGNTARFVAGRIATAGTRGRGR